MKSVIGGTGKCMTATTPTATTIQVIAGMTPGDFIAIRNAPPTAKVTCTYFLILCDEQQTNYKASIIMEKLSKIA